MAKRAPKKTAGARLVVPPVEPPSCVPREDDDPLKPGDVVTLPDGSIAAIEQIVGSDAHVIEWTKRIGRGPWIFPLSELSLVS